MAFTSRFPPPSFSQPSLSEVYCVLTRYNSLNSVISPSNTRTSRTVVLILLLCCRYHLSFHTPCVFRRKLCACPRIMISKKDKDNFVHQTDVSDHVKPFPSGTQDDWQEETNSVTGSVAQYFLTTTKIIPQSKGLTE